MNLKSIRPNTILSIAVVCALPSLVSCGGKTAGNNSSTEAEQEAVIQDSARVGGPQLGAPAVGGPVIDKSGDATLQAMIKELVPQFKQLEYKDAETGKTMQYNLLMPKNMEAGKQYPLVLFMADASTPGKEVTAPLTQGYGALVWATDQWQAENPCYVLVPQFSGVVVNDAYEHTDEADIAIRMLKEVVANNQVDANRLYTTGQSMGGMISMYYNVAYPDLFAASMFVDSHWDKASFPQLVKHKFIYFIAGDSGKAYADMQPLEEAAEKGGVSYTYAAWDAKLPETRQSELAATMLAKGAPINIFQFEPKTVLPESDEGSEHMYSFDYAYKILSTRQWLFQQSR